MHITTHTALTMYAIMDRGYVYTNGVKYFYWWKKKVVQVQDTSALEACVLHHFQRYHRTKYVVVRYSASVWCYKRDMSSHEIPSCSIRPSSFN